MHTYIFLYILAFSSLTSFAQNDSIDYWSKIVEVHNFDDSTSYYFVKTDDLYEEAWYQLEHPVFWRNVMKHNEEVLIINHFQNRSVYGLTTQSYWDQFTDEEKEEKKTEERPRLLQKRLKVLGKIELDQDKKDKEKPEEKPANPQLPPIVPIWN